MKFTSSLLRATLAAGFIPLAALTACSGSSSPVSPVHGGYRVPTNPPTNAPTNAPTNSPTNTPTNSPTASPTPVQSAQPQVVHVGFNHTQTTDPTFGAVAFYSPNSGSAAVVRVAANSQVVFLNDGSGAPHTASGLGSGGFPSSFDNSSGATASGTTINSGTTWSTGTLNPGQQSSAFSVPAGTYYFGCFYHYDSSQMRDVIVSQ